MNNNNNVNDCTESPSQNDPANFKCNLYLYYVSVFVINSEDSVLPNNKQTLNVIYWFFKTGNDVFRWIFSVKILGENISLFCLLLLFTFFKLLLISLSNVFKLKLVKNKLVFALMLLILLVESCVEIPSHYIFRLRRMYIRTNYYLIYDRKKEKVLKTHLNEEGQCYIQRL